MRAGRSLIFLSIIAACMAQATVPKPRAESVPPPWMPKEAPTAQTLARWLEGKENVEVGFAGPATDSIKLRESLEALKTVPEDFRTGVGEWNGKGSISVAMRVTPETTKVLLALQAELTPRGYVLDGAAARVWTYVGSAEKRKESRAAIPEILKSLAAGMKEQFPDAECTTAAARGDALGTVSFHFPKSKNGGYIRVYDMARDPSGWELSMKPGAFEVLHLSHLGIMVYETSWIEANGPIPKGMSQVPVEQAGVDKAFRKAMEPLMKLEPEAKVWSKPE